MLVLDRNKPIDLLACLYLRFLEGRKDRASRYDSLGDLSIKSCGENVDIVGLRSYPQHELPSNGNR